jgi:hypothetical protein
MSVGARCEVARLSHTATLPGAHRNRTVYSGRVISEYSRSRMALDSRGDTSTIWLVNPGFTNSPLAPVTGCTRTTGWIATSRLSSIRLS